jgi:hypothetical protein
LNDSTLTLDGHVLRLSDEILMQCATSEPIEPGQPSRASSSGTRGTPPGRDAQEAMHPRRRPVQHGNDPGHAEKLYLGVVL